MVALRLPPYVAQKLLASGEVAFYWEPPTRDKKRAEGLGVPFPFRSTRLGAAAAMTQRDLDAIAGEHTASLKEWRKTLRAPALEARSLGQYGSVRWLVETYQRSDQFHSRVRERSRPDYRRTFGSLCALPTKDGRTVGDLPVRSISAAAADKLYERMCKGEKWRRGEKVVVYCRSAWKVIARLHPDVMALNPRDRTIHNPWQGVVMKTRQRAIKAAVSRADAYRFAEKAIEVGKPELAAAAVVCFEWLQRPENVMSGKFRWSDYDPPSHRGWISIEHYKTGAVGWHPLTGEDPDTGKPLRFYPEAEAVLARLPRRAVSVCVQASGRLYTGSGYQKTVRAIAGKAGIEGFTLDACRHGGMTELEEAGLTEGQGMALSGHRTPQVYRGYAKRTQTRAIGATLKRHAWRLQNAG